MGIIALFVIYAVQCGSVHVGISYVEAHASMCRDEESMKNAALAIDLRKLVVNRL
jgi:hypothetical protein